MNAAACFATCEAGPSLIRLGSNFTKRVPSLLVTHTEDLKTFDSVAKLDPTSPEQLATMHAHLSHTMPVVNFWLAFCVLPSETKQFPQRLAASAWHLAHNPSGGPVVGFSGTNDNHRLLPLQVRQHVLPYPQLAATNGRMLQVLLDCTAEVHVLEPQVGIGGSRERRKLTV